MDVNFMLHYFGVFCRGTSKDKVDAYLVGLSPDLETCTCYFLIRARYSSVISVVDFGITTLDDAKFHFNYRKPASIIY